MKMRQARIFPGQINRVGMYEAETSPPARLTFAATLEVSVVVRKATFVSTDVLNFVGACDDAFSC